MVLAGIDLAWQSEKNATAIASGELRDGSLNLTKVFQDLYGVKTVLKTVLGEPGLQGIAIDAPLIIPNKTGQRRCEREIGIAYGSRKASCHTSNLTLYPEATSVALSDHLLAQGFKHHGLGPGWQLECYPHPALIEIFSLEERLLYKKGRVSQRREGQIQLGRYLRSLAHSRVLALSIPVELSKYMEASYIETLKGKALKHNEDLLDAIVCL